LWPCSNQAVVDRRLLNRVQFVADHHRRYGVKRLCQVIGVARSSFHHWKATAARVAADDWWLTW